MTQAIRIAVSGVPDIETTQPWGQIQENKGFTFCELIKGFNSLTGVIITPN